MAAGTVKRVELRIGDTRHTGRRCWRGRRAAGEYARKNWLGEARCGISAARYCRPSAWRKAQPPQELSRSGKIQWVTIAMQSLPPAPLTMPRIVVGRSTSSTKTGRTLPSPSHVKFACLFFRTAVGVENRPRAKTRGTGPFLFRGERVDGGRPVHHQPVQADLSDRFAKSVEIHRFLNVTVHAQVIAFNQVFLLNR
jgi:hypothetical protein